MRSKIIELFKELKDKNYLLITRSYNKYQNKNRIKGFSDENNLTILLENIHTGATRKERIMSFLPDDWKMKNEKGVKSLPKELKEAIMEYRKYLIENHLN